VPLLHSALFYGALLSTLYTLLYMLRYAITSDTYLPDDAARLAADGIDYIQLRDKQSRAAELVALARMILAEIAPYPHTRLLINSRADVAVAAGAHGVHLTSRPGELTPEQIRDLFRSTSILCPPSSVPCITSISCHTLDEVARAHTLGADLILFGPVFEKRVANLHITDGSGLDLLRRAVIAAKGTPVLALGGITHENTAACLKTGAAGIAAIRLFA
jgi:thiamine-phosphate pyrophosphorylase